MVNPLLHKQINCMDLRFACLLISPQDKLCPVASKNVLQDLSGLHEGTLNARRSKHFTTLLKQGGYGRRHG